MKKTTKKSAQKKTTKKAAPLRKEKESQAFSLSSFVQELPKKEPRLSSKDKELVGFFASGIS